nr:RluA family pseudouridine synthase [Streptococcus halichoeri]
MIGLMRNKQIQPELQEYSFLSPFDDCTVKTLLEDKLLIPRKIRHFLRTKKHIFVNEEPVTWQSLVPKDSHIRLLFDQEDYPAKDILLGDATLVNCLYQDQHLIVVNKPAGMKTHANNPGELALLNHVSAYAQTTCYVVHRLDQETSGAIIFAKNPFILPLVNRLLESKAISRDYWALVEGHLPSKDLTYRDPIGRHRHDRRKRVVDVKHGQLAVTHVQALKSFPQQRTLINCRLETGRTHQIRVHLAHHHHPLVGDPLYHPNPKGRLMLHAHTLRFTHPLTQKTIRVEAQSDSFQAQLTP